MITFDLGIIWSSLAFCGATDQQAPLQVAVLLSSPHIDQPIKLQLPLNVAEIQK